MASVEERVKQIIVEQLGVDEGEVTPNASFVDDLGADSLDTVELVMAFEEAFEVEIPDEEAEKIRTVQDAIDYIGKHAKAGKIGLKPRAQRRRQVERQELLEPSIDGVEILPRTIRCNG